MKPELLFLEPTNRCNLNCPFCLVNVDDSYTDTAHNSMKRSLGTMDMKLFDKILVDAKAFGIKRIHLEFWGESFLHPYFDEMMIKTMRMGFTTSVFTNGMVINDSRLRVIPNNVHNIIVSIDGASEDSYSKNRVGGNFFIAWENLLKLNSICKNTRTKVVWQFVVMRNNEHEISKAKKLAKKHNVHLRLKTFNPSIAERVSSLKEYIREFSNKPCTSIYKQFAVLWNGDIVPCCQDPDGRCILGNVNEASLLDIWDSEKYNDFRKRVRMAKACPENEPDICKTCSAYKLRI